MPRAASARATPRNDWTPLARISLITGRMFAACRCRLVALNGTLASLGKFRVPELLAPRLGGCQCGLRAIRNHFALVLGHGRQDEDGELVGVWHVAGHELGAAIHERGNEREMMKARLADLGGVALPGSPAEFGKLIAEETEKWAKVIKFAGIKPE
jgi:hypothetical protein